MTVDAVVPEHDGLWAGVWGGGLVRFSATDEVFERQVKPDNREGGLAHARVYALHVDAERRLWVGTYGGGVQYAPLDRLRDGEQWSFDRLPTAGLSLESNMTWSLESGDDGLTIGTGRSVFRWNGATLRELPGAHAIESVRFTLRRADGRRYIATYGEGLFRETAAGVVPVVAGADAPAPVPKAIWSLAEDAGELWLGTTNGVVRLDANDKLIATHDAGLGFDHLPGGVVWVQKHDANARLWLGTSGGLVRVARDENTMRFERQQPLIAAGITAVSSIEFDRNGDPWLGTPNALVRYRPGRGGVDRYDVDDGLISTQVNIHASANDGRRLYFGGMGGFVAFDPAAVPERQGLLSPRVARLRLGQQPWQLDANRLSLEHRHEPIQVEFAALAYADAARVRYAYRWKGLDADFIELGDAQSTVLSRLPTGTHTLELRASTPAPNAQPAVAEVLEVTIAPAWFETAWGRLLIVAAAFALVWGWLQWRLRRARAHARELAQKVDERTRQLDRAAQDLAVANARLRVQATLDPLTGLSNRHHLFEVYAERQRNGEPPGLVICDLDYFKRINDTHGHRVGDDVLKDFARVLHDALGGDGLAARFGGEEFVVLLFDRKPGALEALASRIIDGARTRQVPRDDHAHVRYSASAGIAHGGMRESLEEHVARADTALYAAKHAGRDRWCSGKIATEAVNSE
jgi:diguanylate cyclase (GGDEF)-like protein